MYYTKSTTARLDRSLYAGVRPATSVSQLPRLVMVGKDGGKAKPLKASACAIRVLYGAHALAQAPKKGAKEYDEDDLAFLEKKKQEQKARPHSYLNRCAIALSTAAASADCSPQGAGGAKSKSGREGAACLLVRACLFLVVSFLSAGGVWWQGLVL